MLRASALHIWLGARKAHSRGTYSCGLCADVTPPRAVPCFLRRAQHVVNVRVGLMLAMHTDFFARRGLLTRQLVRGAPVALLLPRLRALSGVRGPLRLPQVSILESVVVVAALTIIGTIIFSRLERSEDQVLEARYSAIMDEVSSKVSPEIYAELGNYISNPRQGDVWALNSQGCGFARGHAAALSLTRRHPAAPTCLPSLR